ncbi:MAG: hypothetical protein COB81_02520 [Flavobacteriaceae bacterium]|nr:MAG: hypothetical protein COB81_02520 [Flavobacteriaceae bacterium]
MKKIVILLAFIAGMFCVNAQSELDAYKYIIVKKQYGFQKSPDKYQLNSLTKFLLAKSDLIVLFDTDPFSDDVALNPCLALKVELVDISGMFSTQLSVNFRDCKNKIIYATSIGKSKSKEYKKAYHEALRISLEMFNTYKHKYTESAPILVKNSRKVSPSANETYTISSTASTEIVIENTIGAIGETTNLLGSYANDKMSFEVKAKGSDFELIHPEIGKIADVYKTSKETIFIVQWTGKNQSRLMEIGADGSLKIDGDDGVNTYKKRQ